MDKVKNKKTALIFLSVVFIIGLVIFIWSTFNKNIIDVTAKIVALNLKDNNITVEVIDDLQFKDKKFYVNVSKAKYINYKNQNDLKIGDYVDLKITDLVIKTSVNSKALEVAKLNAKKTEEAKSTEEDDFLDIDVTSLSEKSQEMIKKEKNLLEYKPEVSNKEVPLIQNVLEYVPLPIYVTEKVSDTQYRFKLEEAIKDRVLTLNVNPSMFLDEEEAYPGQSYIMFIEDSQRSSDVFTPKLLKEYNPESGTYYRLETWDKEFNNKTKKIKLDMNSEKTIILPDGSKTKDKKVLENKLALVGYRQKDAKNDGKSTIITPSSIYVLE